MHAVRVRVIAMGVSTGGPTALEAVLSPLPADLPVPIVVVQHMPAGFTRLLAERLNACSRICVQEGQEGQLLKPGHAYIAPGDHHMEVLRRGQRKALHVQRGPLENCCRPSVDVLFRSVARAYGGAALAVILTGMGKDGLAGCRALAALSCPIYAQDEATSVVWGMPGLVAKAGLAEKVLPLKDVARELLVAVRRQPGTESQRRRTKASPRRRSAPEPTTTADKDARESRGASHAIE